MKEDAVDAIRASASPHHFLSVSKQGIRAIVATTGNPDCHMILRGGRSGPNYSPTAIRSALDLLGSASLRKSVMVDCSHANSGKNPRRQPEVSSAVAAAIDSGETSIFGVMIESFLVHGRQNVVPGQPLTHGQSITDGCLSIEETEPMLETLARAVAARRRR